MELARQATCDGIDALDWVVEAHTDELIAGFQETLEAEAGDADRAGAGRAPRTHGARGGMSVPPRPARYSDSPTASSVSTTCPERNPRRRLARRER
jgi:hypothetical protein